MLGVFGHFAGQRQGQQPRNALAGALLFSLDQARRREVQDDGAHRPAREMQREGQRHDRGGLVHVRQVLAGVLPQRLLRAQRLGHQGGLQRLDVHFGITAAEGGEVRGGTPVVVPQEELAAQRAGQVGQLPCQGRRERFPGVGLKRRRPDGLPGHGWGEAEWRAAHLLGFSTMWGPRTGGPRGARSRSIILSPCGGGRQTARPR